MDRNSAIGVLILGAVITAMILLARVEPRPTAMIQSGIQMLPVTESPHYRNKETRNIEYNADGLPTKIEIIRDFTLS